MYSKAHPIVQTYNVLNWVNDWKAKIGIWSNRLVYNTLQLTGCSTVVWLHSKYKTTHNSLKLVKCSNTFAGKLDTVNWLFCSCLKPNCEQNIGSWREWSGRTRVPVESMMQRISDREKSVVENSNLYKCIMRISLRIRLIAHVVLQTYEALSIGY